MPSKKPKPELHIDQSVYAETETNGQESVYDQVDIDDDDIVFDEE